MNWYLLSTQSPLKSSHFTPNKTDSYIIYKALHSWPLAASLISFPAVPSLSYAGSFVAPQTSWAESELMALAFTVLPGILTYPICPGKEWLQISVQRASAISHSLPPLCFHPDEETWLKSWTRTLRVLISRAALPGVITSAAPPPCQNHVSVSVRLRTGFS